MKEIQLPQTSACEDGTTPYYSTWFVLAYLTESDTFYTEAYDSADRANAVCEAYERAGKKDALYRMVLNTPREWSEFDVRVFAQKHVESNRALIARLTREAFDMPDLPFDYWKAHEAAQKLSARGGFAGCLSDAFFRADKRNAERLARAFPELFGDA